MKTERCYYCETPVDVEAVPSQVAEAIIGGARRFACAECCHRLVADALSRGWNGEITPDFERGQKWIAPDGRCESMHGEMIKGGLDACPYCRKPMRQQKDCKPGRDVVGARE